jgi:hypothetical protein
MPRFVMKTLRRATLALVLQGCTADSSSEDHQPGRAMDAGMPGRVVDGGDETRSRSFQHLIAPAGGRVDCVSDLGLRLNPLREEAGHLVGRHALAWPSGR